MKKPLLKLNNENDIYYNCIKCLSYNAFLNLITGGRGIGKTTSWLIYGVGRALNKNKNFIYLRRYKTEIEDQKDILDPIIDGVKTRGMGSGTKCFKWYLDKQLLGYAMALTSAKSFKSKVFTNTDLIIYDEGIIKPSGTNRYLKDEVIALLELVSTVFRNRTDGKVVILGNNQDVFNPFFEYFKVPPFDVIYYDKKRGIYCELCQNKVGLKEIEEKTPLYKLVKDTQYGDYHYDNKLLVGASFEKGIKGKNAELLFRLVFNTKTLNIYHSTGHRLFVEFREKPILDSLAYSVIKDNEVNYVDAKRMKDNGMVRYAYRTFYDEGLVYENEKAYDLFKAFVDLM